MPKKKKGQKEEPYQFCSVCKKLKAIARFPDPHRVQASPPFSYACKQCKADASRPPPLRGQFGAPAQGSSMGGADTAPFVPAAVAAAQHAQRRRRAMQNVRRRARKRRSRARARAAKQQQARDDLLDQLDIPRLNRTRSAPPKFGGRRRRKTRRRRRRTRRRRRRTRRRRGGVKHCVTCGSPADDYELFTPWLCNHLVHLERPQCSASATCPRCHEKKRGAGASAGASAGPPAAPAAAVAEAPAAVLRPLAVAPAAEAPAAEAPAAQAPAAHGPPIAHWNYPALRAQGLSAAQVRVVQCLSEAALAFAAVGDAARAADMQEQSYDAVNRFFPGGPMFGGGGRKTRRTRRRK